MVMQKVIKNIEEIEQRLTSLQLSMELLATHTTVIKVLTPEEFKNINIPNEELYKYWDKVLDGNNLYTLTNALAINTSEELSILCYEKLDEIKRMLKDVM